MRYHKFIHILMHNSIGFNEKLIKMIINNESVFGKGEHAFVTCCEELFNIYKGKCDIEYYINDGSSMMEMLYKYVDCGDWLIVHSLYSKWYMDGIKEEIVKKVVWRTWGQDIGICCNYPSFKSIVCHLDWILHGDWRLLIDDIKQRKCYKKSISGLSRIHALGVGTSIEPILLGEKFKDMPAYHLPYCGAEEYKILENCKNDKHDDCFHVMIGHSAYVDNHIELINAFEKYKDENIKLHLVLNYGDKDYIERVAEVAREKWGDKIEILTQMMSFSDYAEYLCSMDAAVLNGSGSYALGNIAMLLFFGKKVFLNRKGILAKGFEQEGIEYGYVDMIGKLSYDDLRKSEEYKVSRESTFMYPTYDRTLELWKLLFDDLEKESIA